MNATNTLQSQVVQESIKECQNSIEYYENKLQEFKGTMSNLGSELIRKEIKKAQIKMRIFLEFASTETE